MIRPAESFGVDDDLRIRLEGTIEVLESALPLLESLMYLLSRAQASGDDRATLQECLTQLPRIDEAIDRANRHQESIALTRAVGQRKQAAHVAANERLIALGHEEVPSLRGAVAAVMDLLKRQSTPPGPTERRLAESGGPPWFSALLFGAVMTWLATRIIEGIFVRFGIHLGSTGFVFGALTCIYYLYCRTPLPWVLLPDRLFFPARWPRLSREVVPSAFKTVEIDNRFVVAGVGGAVKLEAKKPEELVTLLRMLGGVWLSGLRSPPRPFLVVDAVDDSTKSAGRALISAEGVLFVPDDRRALIVKALTPQALPTEPSIELVLMLIAHLPEGRWAAMGEHLQKEAGAFWISREDVALTEHVVNARVRLLLSGDARRVEAEALLERLR